MASAGYPCDHVVIIDWIHGDTSHGCCGVNCQKVKVICPQSPEASSLKQGLTDFHFNYILYYIINPFCKWLSLPRMVIPSISTRDSAGIYEAVDHIIYIYIDVPRLLIAGQARSLIMQSVHQISYAFFNLFQEQYTINHRLCIIFRIYSFIICGE